MVVFKMSDYGIARGEKIEKPEVSIIIPAYNEEDNVTELYNNLIPALSDTKKTYEILFIDDGSKDLTEEKLKELTKKDDKVRYVSFRRNFGKAAALSCGFSLAKGDNIITMDGDLQDDPKEIPRFLEELKKYDVVSGWKFKRHDPLTKTLPSKIFNLLTRYITGVNIHDFNCGFKAYRSDVVKNIDLYGELHRYIPAIASWKGFNVGEIKVEHRPRIHGTSKYGIKRLFKGIFDLITIKFLMSYVERPLHLFGGIGLISGSAGFLICAYLLYLWLLGNRIGERPLLMLGVLLLIIGVQFFVLGLLGELIVSSKNKRNWVIKKN
jgi:glycosyltransferase involved in cell wall biosynthesis